MYRSLPSRLVATLVLATSCITATIVGPHASASAAVAPSVLDPSTDVSVAITAPSSLVRGSRFEASMMVSNLGTTTARNIRCGVSTPRVDGATGFTMGISSQRVFDTVEGHESMEFRIGTLAPGKSRRVAMAATSVRGSSTPSFTVSAFCAPERIDQRHTNNSAMVTVALRQSGTSLFG